MCGISGFTGLGHLSAELRYDLVEMLGSGIDKRGGHAAGAVVVSDEGPPRLMRKLGGWDTARGRFVRAASAGHSVMMHARFATHGTKDNVENAHPFAVKRKNDAGEDYTVLYGCHNGILYNAEESAKRHNRPFSVDSLEFFELLADKAYETIKALNGYGVVTWVRPSDRKFRLLKLTSSGDLKVYRLQGGGIVWGSTNYILDEALKYTGLEKATELDVSKVGQVYLLSGDEATETKLDGLQVNAGWVDRRTSGGSSTYSSSTSYGWNSLEKSWDDACWVCGEYNYHKYDCKKEGGYLGNVVRSETIKANRLKFEKACRDMLEGKEEEEAPKTPKALPPVQQPSGPKHQNGKVRVSQVTSGYHALCLDGTYRRIDSNGKLIPNMFPIYVRERLGTSPGIGDYVLAFSISQAAWLSGLSIEVETELAPKTELGQRILTAKEETAAKLASFRYGMCTPESAPKASDTQPSMRAASPTVVEPAEHNGHWAIPAGCSKEEQKAWIELFERTPNLATRLADEAEQEAEKLDEQLTLAVMKGE